MLTDIAYIGLGSNLDKPKEQLSAALVEIQQHPQISIQACSHLYSSLPMGPKDQPDYVNAVCQITTSLSPIELLDFLQSVEQTHGRERKEQRWGPRTLDLDILLYNNQRIESERLTVPHYGMRYREFVLVPLFEIAPDMVMQDGRTLTLWVAECQLDGLKRMHDSIDFKSIAA